MKIKKVFIGTLLGITTVISIHKINKSLTIDPKSISYNTNYSMEDPLYASYEDKEVYISLDEDKLGNGISIVDQRDINQNMKILSSYEITSLKDKSYITYIMLQYNEEHPSINSWDRSYESLLNEWYAHNILYRLNLYRERTCDVDFENAEEDKYKVFTKH